MKPLANPRGGHTRLYWDIQDSPAWRALSWAEKGLWIAMRRKLLASNNGNIEATLGGSGGLRHHGITSSASLAKGLRALEAVGLIEKTRQGLLSQGRRTCNLFRFTDEPTYDFPKLGVKAVRATNDWKRFQNIAAARQSILDAHASAKTGKRWGRRNEESVQPLNGVDSTNEYVPGKPLSTAEAGAAGSIRRLKVVSSQ